MVLQLSSALRQFAQEENGGGGEADVHHRVSADEASALLLRKQAKAARDAHNNGWPAFSAAVTAARPAARDELRKFRMLVSRLIGSEVGTCSLLASPQVSAIVQLTILLFSRVGGLRDIGRRSGERSCRGCARRR